MTKASPRRPAKTAARPRNAGTTRAAQRAGTREQIRRAAFDLFSSVGFDETTTQADIDLGMVNLDVGFRPLKPAEFIVIRIRQLAGQSES